MNTVYECEMCHHTYPKTAIINIVSDSGVLRACPNCLYMAAKNDPDKLELDIIPELECEATGELGAVIYNGFPNEDTGKTERYILNPDTMKRLLTYKLNMDEYIKLYIRHGNQFMLHDDLYTDYRSMYF